MTNSLSSILTDLDSQISDIQAIIDSKNEQIAQLQLDIQQLQAEIPTLQLELDGLAEMRTNGQKLLGLNAEFNSSAGKITYTSSTNV